MPRKFTESPERVQSVTVTLTFAAGNNPSGALVSATFGTRIVNDDDSSDATQAVTGSITFDGLIETRSIGARTFRQITNAVVDMVNDVRATPIA